MQPDYGLVLSDKFNLRSVLGFIISGVLLWLAIHQSGLELRSIHMSMTEGIYFAGSMFAFVLATWFQSMRAKIVWLKRGANWKEPATFSSLSIGNFYNCVLPGNLGDAVRAWHFARRQRIPFASSLASIITEKWLDAQMFVVISVILFMISPLSGDYIFLAIYYTATVAALLGILYLLMLRYVLLEKALWRIVVALRRPGRFLYRIYKYASWQMSGIRQHGFVGAYLFFCSGAFLLNVAQFFLLLKAAGISGPVASVYTAYLTAVSMMIIAFIPSAPSNVGVLHYGLYLVLILAAKINGAGTEHAALQSYALFGIYTHLSFLVPEVVVGGVFLLRDGRYLYGQWPGDAPVAKNITPDA